MAAPGHKTVSRQDLAGSWLLSFDDDADWGAADIHLPGKPVHEITPTPPTGGWDVLDHGVRVEVPCITEVVRPGFHGVSWWSRTVDTDEAAQIRLQFKAARLMVEIYWDHQLVGYDLEGYTPFEVVIPEHLKTPGSHQLDVRITNPGGSDNWEDLLPLEWAGKMLPSSQDFGGIWQTVLVEQSHGARIEDLWVRSSETLDEAIVEVECECENKGVVQISLLDPSSAVVSTQEHPVSAGNCTVKAKFPVVNPMLYDIGKPNLYRITAELSAGNAADHKGQNFGFRNFDLVEDRIELNGREIYLKTSISWCLYTGGPVSSEAELEDEIKAIEAFGQNALTAHRRCANPELIDALEDRGLLLYQEPGGLPSLRNRMGCGDWMEGDELEFALTLAKERVRRLAKRDRSRACLVWWNLANECLDPFDGEPGEPARELMNTLRGVDDSRVSTWTSAWNPTPMYRPFRSDESQSFDFHGVLNWPSMWHPALEQEVGAVRPPRPMVAIAGESQNFTSLAGVTEMASQHGPAVLEGSVSALTQEWADRLGHQLSRIDPKAKLGGPEAFCNQTTEVQGHGVARLTLHHRANPDINGLALNGWHSHHRIGTMGITRMDRKPSFDPAFLAEANRSVQIVAKGLKPVLAVGDPQVCSLVLIDDENLINTGATLTLSVTIHNGNKENGIFEIKRTATATSRARVKMLGELDLGVLPAGNYQLTISGEINSATLRFSERFMIVAKPNLQGQSVTLYDPIGDLTPFFRESGANLLDWRLYQAGRPFVSVSNLRVLHTLFGNGIERAVCLLRSTTPRSNSLGTIGDLKKVINNDEPIRPVKVLGHWNGGWGFSLDDTILPSLGAARVWDWCRSGIFPQYMIANLSSRVLSGACSFQGGGAFSTGDITMGATTAIVQAAGTEVMITTLPLIEALPTDPLAASLLGEMTNWLNSRGDL